MIITYEKENCGRCGGTGQYSYNQITGTRCFGCGGKKTCLTKRGKAAKAFADTLLDLPIEQVQVGQRVTYTWINSRTTVTVQSIERTEGGKCLKDGEWHTFFNTHLHGATHKIVGSGITVRATPTTEQVEQITAYQDSLTKAGKPRAR
jgi:hypothetical protein